MTQEKKIGYLDYNKNLKQFSRQLRNNSTLGEILLWNQLKAGKMLSHKFNRQKPLGKYIVDFYCKKLNLVIEVDGSSHNDKYEQDKARENELAKMSLSILRFSEQQCRKDILNVVRGIESWITDNFTSLINKSETVKTNPPVRRANTPFTRGR